mmetsp:Transcript_34951/g.66770  ORF Transcript_34951/g.66770 Transcript_34951/m.66770 type:complete len:132 (+) Transcript_34951:112-507(+)|eukprot:CAMPEP_0114245004 /NCGR_PEP_ID=MMETSP0058-20121206/11651_1 /TAXON_ID=36894 /ORGANISM="Pyramimonas parkeae, CCMP726" /LENGTH=131 /DNA_ID=CAMNT_0001358001 /DNA_START=372 /DNA_END=767 /DNA_ORIENTATION=+
MYFKRVLGLVLVVLSILSGADARLGRSLLCKPGPNTPYKTSAECWAYKAEKVKKREAAAAAAAAATAGSVPGAMTPGSAGASAATGMAGTAAVAAPAAAAVGALTTGGASMMTGSATGGEVVAELERATGR